MQEATPERAGALVAAARRSGLATAVLALQRSAGNRTVGWLLRQPPQIPTPAPAPGTRPPPPPPPGAGPGWQYTYPPVATTPRDKLTAFVKSVGTRGLPSKLFAPVLKKYSIDEADVDENYTSPWTDTIVFKRNVLDKVGGAAFTTPATLSFAGDAGTIFHETVHAFLDVMQDDPKVKPVIDQATAYYKDAPLGDGSDTTSDPGRVFTEAAAEYVDARVSEWWMTMSVLTTYIGAGKLSQKLLDKQRRDYDAMGAKRVFGYDETMIRKTKRWTTRPISPDLKKFLDDELLEGKLPDKFDDVPAFKALLDGVQLVP